MEKERWKEIPGFDDYFVSTLGRIRSFKQRGGGRVLRQVADSRKYKFVNLRGNDGKQHIVYTHRVVCLAFIGARPQGQHIRHLDCDSSNNRLENLRYGTAKENGADTILNNYKRYGKDYWREVVADKSQIYILRKRLRDIAAKMVISDGMSQKSVAEKLGLSIFSVCRSVGRALTKSG